MLSRRVVASVRKSSCGAERFTLSIRCDLNAMRWKIEDVYRYTSCRHTKSPNHTHGTSWTYKARTRAPAPLTDWNKLKMRELKFFDALFPKSVAPTRSHQNDTYFLYGLPDAAQLESVAPVKFLTPLIGVLR